MRVYGYAISKQVIDDTISELKKDFSFTALETDRILQDHGVPRVVGYKYISIAAASRLVQRLKKEGRIKTTYGGGANTIWYWIKKSR